MKIILIVILIQLNFYSSFASDCSDCVGPDKVASKLSLSQKAALQVLCDTPYKKEDWDEITKEIGSIRSYEDIDEQSYLILLSKYTKPGSVQTLEDEKIFVSLYYYALYKRGEDLYKFNYADIYGSSSNMESNYNLLKGQLEYYRYEKDKNTAYQKSLCLTKEEKRDQTYKWLVESAKQIGYGDRTAVPGLILANLDFIKSLSKEKQDEIFYPLYRGLGATLAEHYGITISKALIFTKNYVNDLFGREKAKELVDVTASANGKSILILSSSPISKLPSYAYVPNDTLPMINISSLTLNNSQKISFTTRHKNFTADVKVEKIKIGDFIDKSPAPNYKELLADKKLTGMTLVSPNLGHWKDKASQNYLSYYLDEGFKFDKPLDMKSSTSWIEEKISSGEIDYILKEAHSGGNNYDLIGLSSEHKLMTGRKKLADGTEEVIYLLFPQGYEEDARVTFADMNKWMEKREKDGKGQLLYLNSSCWSMDDVPETIGGIRNKNFLNIAATKTTTTFFNGENSTKFQIIEGIRNQKNYSEIHKDMSKTTRHKKGHNDFIFPGEKRYLEVLTEDNDDSIKNYDISLLNEEGKQIFLHDN